MKAKSIIAIDPGSSNGGLALWQPGQPAQVMRMPPNDDISRLSDYFEHIKNTSKELIVFVEKVTMFGADSDAENKGKQFRIKIMLANYERIISLLIVHKIEYIEVYPQSWQAALQLRRKWVGSKEEKQKQKKEAFKQFAVNAFPEVKVTLWNSDALCILQYALSKTNNKKWVLDNSKNNRKGLLF